MSIICAIPYGGGSDDPIKTAIIPLWEGKATQGQVIPLTPETLDNYPVLLVAFDFLGMDFLQKKGNVCTASVIYDNNATGGHVTVRSLMSVGTSGITVTQLTYIVHIPSSSHSAQIAWANGITGIYAITAASIDGE